MSQQSAGPVDEDLDATSGGDVATPSIVDAVDERAAQLTGAAGAAATDAPVASNVGAVAQAEAHLEEVDLGDDRETLKKIQRGM